VSNEKITLPKQGEGERGRGNGSQNRPVILRDVADAAGVHISTASRALDDRQTWRLSAETVKRVREAAASLGYMPDLVASGLKRGQTKTVGVVVAGFDNPYNAPLIRGISWTLEASGFIALVAETGESHERFERILFHLMQRRVDAIITAAVRRDDRGLIEKVIGEKIPVILVTRSFKDAPYPTVLHDDVAGGALAAQHLIRLGHRRLAQLRGPADIDTFERRQEGFSKAVKAASLAEAVDLTIDQRAESPDVNNGRWLMELTLAQEVAPTAVFCPTDTMAVGALEAVAGRGLRCPEDISIVGYNDTELAAHLSPPLTSVRLPSEELGRVAAEAALQAINDPDAEPPHHLLPATLIERRSTTELKVDQPA
jgi:LacI family transcriptional regulator